MRYKWVWPLIILLILVTVWGFRYKTNAYLKPDNDVFIKWKTDRWTGRMYRETYTVFGISDIEPEQLVALAFLKSINAIGGTTYERKVKEVSHKVLVLNRIALGVWIALFSATLGWLFYVIVKKDKSAST